MKSFIVLMAFLLTSQSALAWGAKGDHGKHGEHLKKELNLTDEQLAKVQEIKKSKRAEVVESRKKFKELKSAFKTAMKDPKSSNEELRAKFEAFQTARDAFQRNRFAMMLEMRAILNPEQLEKFMKLKKEWRYKKHKNRKDRQ